ncbi:MAG TPA: alpha-amylase family glycosyl hydrolase, partial [Beijerinckiaceae bacterium]|nr:alpha-amylase family glycosyl hydrolase [Beijerinckiaceae bacterium]
MRPAKATAAHSAERVSAPAPGPRIYNLFPLLVGQVSGWRAELPRIAAMNFDWVYVNPFHETGGSRSLYAIRDPFRLDPRFRDEREGSDDDQIRAFAEDAASHGLKVMADLVINHTANDARLVEERPDVYDRDEAGGIRSPFAVDPHDPSIVTVWGDLAELSYREPEAKDFLLQYWDGYVARLQQLGIRGFRCDAAYKVPPEVWRHLIGRAKERDRGCLFAAETLGCTFDETQATAGAGFDYLFNSFAWWNLRAPWALEAYEALRTVAPSIAFPENHDMARLAAGLGEDETAVAAHLKARYALSAFFSSGVLMPIGYEWGYRRPLHVVETTPEQREKTGIDISDFVAAINVLRAELPAANTEGAQWRLSAPDATYLALLRFDSGHPASARNAMLVLANLSEAPLAVRTGPLLARSGGYLGQFAERTPGEAPASFRPGETVTLAPNAVRVFAARRAP